jgi:hypothetical protein
MNARTNEDTFPEERRIAVLVHSAIAGASIAATFALVARSVLEPLLLIALGCFAVAIPSAIAMVILSQVIYEVARQNTSDHMTENQYWPALSYVLAVVDQIACYFGFVLLFWFFHWIIGGIFLLATVLALLTTWMAEWRIRKRMIAVPIDSPTATGPPAQSEPQSAE